ncbi:MAG: hypothetical protein E7488_00585 [Ruminococcaceae bacterium]|nr:hypothetical protein [Oscillospiraceae bacterium]
MLRPHTELGLKGGFIAIPIVLLFVWLFNSYQLGKFGNKNTVSPKSKIFYVILVLFIVITSIVIGFLLLYFSA